MARIAILGAAHIHTPNFVKTLAARGDHRTVVVYDLDFERASRVAEILNAEPTTELGRALGDDIDAVVVCSETVHHARLVGAACDARKPLFVEKPLGMNGADALEMQRRIDAAGVTFQTGFFMRGAPAHRFLKTEIDKGTFGHITHVRASNCHAGSLKGWFDQEWRWMANPAIAGVGAFGDLGAHVVDLLVWLLGPVARVTAELRTATHRYGDCDELGEGLLAFNNGTLGSIVAGWVDVANPQTLLVSGTEGMAWIDKGKLYVSSEKLGANGREPWTALPEALPHAFDQFLDVLSGKSMPLVSAVEAAYGCRVVDAMYAAANERRWVDL